MLFRRGLAFLVVVLGASCATLAGLDEDFQVGPTVVGSGGMSTGTAGSAGGSTTASTASGAGTGGNGGSITTTGSAGSSGSGGAGGGVVNCTGSHTCTAVIADCIEIPYPDPDACEAYSGVGQMTISTAAYNVGTPHHAFLRFDLEPQVAQSQLAAMTLYVTVGSASWAGSSNSGEIWRVVSFTRADLFGGAPSNVGSSALAPSQGAVGLNETVSWSLPTDIVDNDSVFLEMRPLVSDNTAYVNLNGTPPPELVVDCL